MVWRCWQNSGNWVCSIGFPPVRQAGPRNPTNKFRSSLNHSDLKRSQKPQTKQSLFIFPVQKSGSGTRLCTFYVVWLNFTWLIAFPFWFHGLILCYLNLCNYIASYFPWMWLENREQQNRKWFSSLAGSSTFPTSYLTETEVFQKHQRKRDKTHTFMLE